METLLQNLRRGWRALAKSSGFTIVAILILALGNGANIAIFRRQRRPFAAALVTESRPRTRTELASGKWRYRFHSEVQYLASADAGVRFCCGLLC
jgi:hypothetical protein